MSLLFAIVKVSSDRGSMKSLGMLPVRPRHAASRQDIFAIIVNGLVDEIIVCFNLGGMVCERLNSSQFFQ